jgi:hypothetical protein
VPRERARGSVMRQRVRSRSRSISRKCARTISAGPSPGRATPTFRSAPSPRTGSCLPVTTLPSDHATRAPFGRCSSGWRRWVWWPGDEGMVFGHRLGRARRPLVLVAPVGKGHVQAGRGGRPGIASGHPVGRAVEPPGPGREGHVAGETEAGPVGRAQPADAPTVEHSEGAAQGLRPEIHRVRWLQAWGASFPDLRVCVGSSGK